MRCLLDDASRGSSAEPTREPVNMPPLPSGAMIIVPVRNFVLFPGMVMPITVGRLKSLSAAQQAVREQQPVGILRSEERRVGKEGRSGGSPYALIKRWRIGTSCAKLYLADAVLRTYCTII